MSLTSYRYRVASFEIESMVDGPGIRNVIFFQGCPHHCQGCHNPQTWDTEGGEFVNLETTLNEWKENKLVGGLTFSGGDPLSFLEYYRTDSIKFNIELSRMLSLIIKAFEISPAFSNIILYTGYTFDEINSVTDPKWRILLSLFQFVIPEPFILEKRSLELPFRGSSNQEVYTFFTKNPETELRHVNYTRIWDMKDFTDIYEHQKHQYEVLDFMTKDMLISQLKVKYTLHC